MRHALDRESRFQQCEDRFGVVEMRCQKGFTHGGRQFGNVRIHLKPSPFEEDLSGQGVAVGMKPPRGQTQENITGVYVLTPYDEIFLHHTGDHPYQIVFSGKIGVGHFRRFSSHQGNPHLTASLGHPLHYGFNHVRVQSVAGNVVHQNIRSCPQDHDVVAGSTHQVNPNGVVPVHHSCHHHFGPDAVYTLDKNRMGIAPGHLVQIDHSSERSYVG